jgi:hydrogenase maturation protease
MSAKPFLILYIGNPIVRNDQVGLIVGRRLAERYADRRDVEVREFIGSPLDLIGEIEGYPSVVLIDSMVTGTEAIGAVRLYREEELLERRGDVYPHGMNLPEAVILARRLGLEIPQGISLVGIEVGPIGAFAEAPSPELAASLERIYGEVLEAVRSLVP